MSNVNTDGLPPEMQARIASIINNAKQQVINNGAQEQQATAPIVPTSPTPPAPVKPPSLMDHVILLRQEVEQLSQQVAAMGQVTQAVGNAVGELYNMFHQQTETTTYSQNFQNDKQEMNKSAEDY